MKVRLLGILLWALLAQASCGREAPPAPLPSPPASAGPPPPPAAPRPVRTSFQGTWLTDQGALVVSEEEDRYRGLFLPLRQPCAFFRSKKSGSLIFADAGDGNLRWEGVLEISASGREIEGHVAPRGSRTKLPCRGRKIGSAASSGETAFLEALEDEDAWVRRSAAEALGALGPAGREAVPGLVRTLRDASEEVRRQAAFALARLGAPTSEAIPSLICLLQDASPEVRTGAAEALGAIGAEASDALTPLLDSLQYPAGAARAAILEALLQIGTLSVPAFVRALGRTGRPAVEASIAALARKGAGGRELLAALAGAPTLDPDSRALARKALEDISALPAGAGAPPAGFDWPQWRGPDKDNVSKETGLLSVWPQEGPPLGWELWGLGDGIAAPAVRDGRLFALGFIDGWEYLSALDAASGRCLWTSRLGPGALENSHMRWVAQRTPTAGPGRVYAYLNSGELICLRVNDGKELWRVDYQKQFGDRFREYGFTDHPILDGDRLICTPASKETTLAALDPATGGVIWKTRVPDAPASSAPSTVVMTLSGTRQYVVSTGGIHGFGAPDGRHLWSYTEGARQSSQVQTPVSLGGSAILVRPSWDRIAVLACGSDSGTWTVQESYRRKQSFGWLHDSWLVLGSRLFVPSGATIQFQELCAAPEIRSELLHTTGNDSSMVAADGHLIVLGSRGRVALIDARGKDMILRSTFDIPRFVQSSGTTNPVLARGRLYIRDSDRLLCYDLREGGAGRRTRLTLEPPASPPVEEPSRAAFVSTPRDVVERMLDLARLDRKDVLVDLGSGDGRIVIAAAKRGCAEAVGYEIDPGLVEVSREALRQAGIANRSRIEARDLFGADLSRATVVALYLPEELLKQLRPQLEGLSPGARIVSHQFRIPGVPPDKELTVDSREDGGRHTLYLWTAPLQRKKD